MVVNPEFSENLIGEDFFMLFILYACLGIVLMINSALTVIPNFKSDREIYVYSPLEGIKNDLKKKDDVFFYNEPCFVEEDDQMILDKIQGENERNVYKDKKSNNVKFYDKEK